jgi:hypothetical protein
MSERIDRGFFERSEKHLYEICGEVKRGNGFIGSYPA